MNKIMALGKFGGFEDFQRKIRREISIGLEIQLQKDPKTLKRFDEYFAQVKVDCKSDDLITRRVFITYPIFNSLRLTLNLKEDYRDIDIKDKSEEEYWANYFNRPESNNGLLKYFIYRKAFKESDNIINNLNK
jgi:hypothetical protein